MKLVAVVAGALALSGCSTSAMPNYFAGKYYMVGDDVCRSITSISDSSVACYDKKGKLTGSRVAMTPESMQYWQARRAQQQADFQQLNDTYQRINQQSQAFTQQMLQQGQQYQAPQAQPSAIPSFLR